MKPPLQNENTLKTGCEEKKVVSKTNTHITNLELPKVFNLNLLGEFSLYPLVV